MRSHDLPNAVDERLLVAMRKAALMVHWVPDLGVTLTQRGRPQVRVATWRPVTRCAIDLHPCEFRRMVVELVAGDVAGLATITFEQDGDMEMNYVATASTTMGPHGMVRHQMTDDRAMYAFPTLLHPDHLPGGDVDHDEELGVSLVHTAFSVGDRVVEQQMFETMFDLATTCAAEEVATLMGR